MSTSQLLTARNSTFNAISTRTLRVALDLEVGDPLAWAFPKDAGDSLLRVADRFLIDIDRDGILEQIKDRYYGHTDKFDYVGTRNFIRHYESRLPRFRAIF